MKFSHFFVDRPIFATVLALLLLIVGGIAYKQLPIAQYPEIAPPTIVIRAQYPGADADTHRAGGERRREHALHVVLFDQ